jgi:DNA-binding response OmpR family regulator
MQNVPDTSALSVLVVEDDPKLAALLTRGLRESGMRADAALSGEDALDHVDAGRFDVIVLDVLLPGIDGLEVFRLLRERGCAAAVVFLTAHWDLPDRAVGAVHGVDDLFPKPFSFEELAGRVRELAGARA